MIKGYRLIPLILFIPSYQTAVAQSLAIPEVVVVGSRIEQAPEQVGSSVVVIHADEFKERGIVYLTDALREVPALNASSYGPRGSQVQIRVRGNESNHLLVLIDGVRMSRADTGEFDFANLTMATVEKIEVILGPQSTLYGSDAAAGVISITTKKGMEGTHGMLKIATGSNNTQTGTLQLSGANERFNYALTGDYNKSDGISAGKDPNGTNPLENDGFVSRSLNTRLGYDHDLFSTWIIFNQSHSQYDFDDDSYTTGHATDNPHNQQWSDQKSTTWVIELPTMEGQLNHRIQLADINNDYETYANDLANAPFGGVSTYLAKTDRQTVEYQGDYQISENNILQFGAEQINENLKTNYTSASFGTSVFDESVAQRGWYGQWLSTLGAVDFTIGGRRDSHDEYGHYSTHRVTLNYRLSEQWRVHGAYGTGYKPPSLLDLYGTSLGGNTALKPEESDSTEVALEYAQNGYKTSITVFDQNTTNLIRWVPDVATPWTGKLYNVDNANSRGVELALMNSWGNYQLDGSFTWLDASETKSGVTKRRMRVPARSANILLSYYHDKGRYFIESLYHDERRDQNFATSTDVTLDAYSLLNLGANYELPNNLTLSARVDNLTDETYEEVFSYGTAGRTFNLSVDCHF